MYLATSALQIYWGELSKEKLDCAESERRRGCCLEYHCPTQNSSCAQISLHTSSKVYSNALHRNSDMQCTVHLFCMSAMLGNFWTKIPQPGNVYTAMCRDVVLCQLVGKSDHSRLRMSPMVPQRGRLFSHQTPLFLKTDFSHTRHNFFFFKTDFSQTQFQ